ncbi:MAG: hypothetical protein HDR03_15470 [Lachnospiraceae bacterium]|nr:hypothetical protein [Lachnospiraceae bacterium]
MAKEKRFVFLSDKFYQRYSSVQYPEIEQKHDRPYIQIYIEVNGIKFAIPLRSDIHHPHVLWTDKQNHCGVDFSKAVVITDDDYIDKIREPHLRQNEFDALRGKDFKIKQKMQKYIDKYKMAKMEPEKTINKTLLKYSTLQYFEEYL